MSRSFRHSPAFEDTRAEFAARKNAREARKAAFQALGFDDAETLAVRPLHKAYKGQNRGSILNA